MNPDTERRLAAMIMEEANMMRQRAEKDGVGAYLKPVVKARPNRQFLTAMVRGVQHANRIVDMEEMWRQRELENKATRDKYSRRSRNEERSAERAERDHYAERRNSSEQASQASHSSSSDQDDNGLRDEDIEKFLHSKVKRGRGAVGSRMDEPGPYRARLGGPASDTRLKEDWEERIPRPVVGPSLPPERAADVALDARRESKKHKERSSRADSSHSDEVEVKDRKLRRESKERTRKKDKRKSKDSEKHSKKKKKSRH